MKFNENAFSLKYNDCTFTFILKDAHHYLMLYLMLYLQYTVSVENGIIASGIKK